MNGSDAPLLYSLAKAETRGRRRGGRRAVRGGGGGGGREGSGRDAKRETEFRPRRFSLLSRISHGGEMKTSPWNEFFSARAPNWTGEDCASRRSPFFARMTSFLNLRRRGVSLPTTVSRPRDDIKRGWRANARFRRWLRPRERDVTHEAAGTPV